jgi:hypothetical protein
VFQVIWVCDHIIMATGDLSTVGKNWCCCCIVIVVLRTKVIRSRFGSTRWIVPVVISGSVLSIIVMMIVMMIMISISATVVFQ